jgi:hypothetical protein
MYYELQQLPQLAASKPDKIADYLPDNVTYKVATRALIHTCRGGQQVVTTLSMINLQAVSLIADGIRRQPISRA